MVGYGGHVFAYRRRSPLMPLAESFDVGGRLAVDFANTANSAGALSWAELILFLERARVISPERANRLLTFPESDPQAADALVYKAEKLRSAIRDLFGALIQKRAPGASAVEIINQILRITEGHDELVADRGSLRMVFVARESGPEWLLAAIARSAAEIVSEGANGRLRVCANSACGLLFYDSSRTRRRRWCSMAVCGNRHKVAAFARRHSPSRILR
jgi:predicted RNA-binding Zn ribbon-like protein